LSGIIWAGLLVVRRSPGERLELQLTTHGLQRFDALGDDLRTYAVTRNDGDACSREHFRLNGPDEFMRAGMTRAALPHEERSHLELTRGFAIRHLSL
jgi:hypothetical protein